MFKKIELCCRKENWSICIFISMAGSRAGKMKRILCSDWLATRAGKMGLSCSLRISCFVPAKAKFFGVIFWPYNKSFIDQACLVKMAGYWSHSFFEYPVSSHLDLTLDQ